MGARRKAHCRPRCVKHMADTTVHTASVATTTMAVRGWIWDAIR